MSDDLHILRHSLGLNEDGDVWRKQGRDEGDGDMGFYRNRYVSDPTEQLTALVAAGLLEDKGAVKMYGGMHLYRVTPLGLDHIKRNEKKLSPAQRRYRKFLDADCGLSFGEWLRCRKAEGAR